MKNYYFNMRGTIAIALFLAAFMSVGVQAQTMYLMKDGAVAFSSPVADISRIVVEGGAATDGFSVEKNDGSAASQTLFSNLKQLSFSGSNLVVEPLSGSSQTFAISNVRKVITYKDNVGIDELSADNEHLTVYPNPTTGQLTVDNGELTIEQVEVYDMYGKLVLRHSERSESIRLDISGLAGGIYLLRIKTEQGVTVKKVINK